MYGRSDGGIRESIVELEAFARNAMGIVECYERSVYENCCIVRWGCGCGAFGGLLGCGLSSALYYSRRYIVSLQSLSFYRSMLSIPSSLCKNEMSMVYNERTNPLASRLNHTILILLLLDYYRKIRIFNIQSLHLICIIVSFNHHSTLLYPLYPL